MAMNNSKVRASARSHYGMSHLLNYKVGRTETRNHMIDLPLLDRISIKSANSIRRSLALLVFNVLS
jgi:hypothetical protein